MLLDLTAAQSTGLSLHISTLVCVWISILLRFHRILMGVSYVFDRNLSI